MIDVKTIHTEVACASSTLGGGVKCHHKEAVMQTKNRVGFWLWNALFGGLFSLIWVYHGGRAFLIAGAALVVYNGLRAFLVFRHRVRRLAELKERKK